MNAELVWLLLFIIAWAIVLLVVPRDRIIGLLLPGFLGGAVLALIVNLIGVPVMGLWRFPATTVSVLGIPVFLLLAFMAEVVLFLYYWEHLPGGSTEKGLFVVAFSLVTTGLGYVALVMRYAVFVNWNLLYFFLTSLGVHILSVVMYSAPGIRESFRRV
jgi:hypothetical protein